MILTLIILVATLKTALETDALSEEPTSSRDFSRRGSNESAALDFNAGVMISTDI
jgi:hypothetical protein